MRLPACETVVALVEVEWFVAKEADGNETFAVVLVDFGIDTEVGHSADGSIKFLSNLVGHEFHLLVLDAGTLGIGSQLLHVGRVFAESFVLLLAGTSGSLGITGEQTMNHEVRVTTDWRSEMCVEVERQSVMSDVDGAVARLHHGTEGDGLHELLDRLVLHVLEQFVETLRHFGLGALRANHVAKLADEVLQVVELGWVRHVVHTVRQCLCLSIAFLHLAHAFSHRAVCQQHELLDELVGILGALEIHAERFALLVDVETWFHAVEVDGTVLHSSVAQLVRHAVEDNQFVLIGLGRLGTLCQWLFRSRILVVLGRCLVVLFEQVLHFLIDETAVALYDGVDNAMVEHVGILIHLEDDGEAEFLLVGTERADEVAESLGKHRYCAVHEIDGGASLLCFLVDDGAFEHIVRHIGNVDTHFPHAFLDRADGDGIVEVLGIARVDGEGEHIAEVLALGNLLGRDAWVDAVGSLLHSLWVFVWQTKLSQDGMHLSVVVSALAEDVNHFADRVAGILWPRGDLHQCLLARVSSLQLVDRDEDVVRQRTVGIDEEGKLLAHLQTADERLLVALDDFDDLSVNLLRATLLGKEADLHLVAW